MIMSLSDNKTGELWESFMRRRKKIMNSIGTALYSIQVYDHLFFNDFNPDNAFEKWATVEVANFNTLPDEMETFTLPQGLYAVFLYRGPVSESPEIFRFIFKTWLPNSEYTLDHRPHFEILGEKYKNDDPGSQEEIWIPIRPKK